MKSKSIVPFREMSFEEYESEVSERKRLKTEKEKMRQKHRRNKLEEQNFGRLNLGDNSDEDED